MAEILSLDYEQPSVSIKSHFPGQTKLNFPAPHIFWVITENTTDLTFVVAWQQLHIFLFSLWTGMDLICEIIYYSCFKSSTFLDTQVSLEPTPI